MSLTEYKAKRKLNKTPEPSGGNSSKKKLQFVIQKHAASHLHYDFRLEMRGVLKSWAVPKGPSIDPKVNRLAMLVEDHPLDYKDFEGIIPPGNYGAGTVMIWDYGTYEPVEKTPDKKNQEKSLLKQFYSGALKFYLHGKKVKGLFKLVKAPQRGSTSWLLTKVNDRYATSKDISEKDRSVVSTKTIEELAVDEGANEWISNRKKEKKTKNTTNTGLKELITKGQRSSMPSHLSPMLCTLIKEPLDDDDYLYEIKWDGYRIISYSKNGKVTLHSRSGLAYTNKYPNIVHELKALGHEFIMDGEVVVLNNEGLPDFNALQNYNGQDTPIVYYIFDIIWLDGYDLKQLPLVERRKILTHLINDSETLKVNAAFDDGPALYEEMLKRHLEGIVAKKKDSVYREGERKNNWLKIPTRKQQEFVIGGWAESEKARSFRSLLFGAYNDDGEFKWVGRSGGGYKGKEMPGILEKLKKREIKKSPFVNKVLDTKGAIIHWVKPQLVANFEFADWTNSGRIRKPATFLGFRKDKDASDVMLETPKSVEKIENENKTEDQEQPTAQKKLRTKSNYKIKDENWEELEKLRVTSEEVFDIGDCKVKITNVEKEIWKGITKAQLIQYYHTIAPLILPHLKDRPLSLHIKHQGVHAQGLYIKDMAGREPDCAEIFSDKRRHLKKGKRNVIDYLVCNNEATLLYAINLGSIDINPWMSTKEKPGQPDFINIDLDPTDDDFNKVIEVALAAKQILLKYKLTSFIKTSGKTGMHIYLPVSGIDNAGARRFSELLGKEIHGLVPSISTVQISKDLRGNKVLIDPSQNDYADTLACAYSVRPYHIPTISTPLEWKEVKKGLNPAKFTIETIHGRIEKKGELFKDILDLKNKQHNYKMLSKI
jgi:bifunctional non-homologous end joining protein LigD